MGKTVMELCFEIEGQTAIVTGASSELGVTLAERGVNMVIAARRYDKLVKVAEDLSNKHGVKVVPLQTDVSQEEQVVKMVKAAADKFGSLEILVNNAGIASISPSVDMALSEWQKVIDVNSTGSRIVNE